MSITALDLENVLALFTQKTGIIPRESHKQSIRNFVEKRIASLSPAGISYAGYLNANKDELSLFINESTVNETYFFREQAQFDFLKNSFFPEWISKNGAKPLSAWCAASSRGEEPYSLALVAKASHVSCKITASDINTAALEYCRNGIYKKNSLREFDGQKYMTLLSPFQKSDGTIVLTEDVKQTLTVKPLNLIELADEATAVNFPKEQSLIFMRNVFIYFSRELKQKILRNLCKLCLAPGGILLFSISEIASVDAEITPKELKKMCSGSVFYFRKEE